MGFCEGGLLFDGLGVLLNCVVILLGAEIDDSFVEVRKCKLGVDAQGGRVVA